jgi:hypothetical protein
MAKKQSRKRSTGGGTPSARAGRSASSRSRGRKAAAKGKTTRAAGRKTARATTSRKRAGAAKKTTPRKRAASARGGARGRSRRPEAGGQLSRSTVRAKWIESPEERDERPGQTLATRNHDVIQRWADARSAQPATIPGGDPESPRVLRFDFPGFGGQTLEPVGWDEWFKTFDARDLVLLYQEHLKNGNESNFFRFDNPKREDA